jgi:glycosyltransferase involved in cell wall biosynthesis
MRKTLSVAIITHNEEANLARTLDSVAWADEIVVVDSGSEDRTEEIAKSRGARFHHESWKGFAAQKNLALEKCTGDWVLSLDADEALSDELAEELKAVLAGDTPYDAYTLPRRNYFLGRWIRHGGFYPDPKLRLFRRGVAQFEVRPVHETVRFDGRTGRLQGDLLHDAYPTLTAYLAHMNRYSTLGAQHAVGSGRPVTSAFAFMKHVCLNPLATFFYNYFFRLGFLDGREGLLLHLYHSGYVSWKYAKAWELSRRR